MRMEKKAEIYWINQPDSVTQQFINIKLILLLLYCFLLHCH